MQERRWISVNERNKKWENFPEVYSDLYSRNIQRILWKIAFSMEMKEKKSKFADHDKKLGKILKEELQSTSWVF